MPRTQPFKKIREQAAATRAKLNGELGLGEAPGTNGRTQTHGVNGSGVLRRDSMDREMSADPNAQLEIESRRIAGSEDVDMID